MESPIAEDKLNDRRKAVVLNGFPLLALSFQTLGIVYSDIGTSPLYALNGIWVTTPSAEDVVGGISAIIWALTLLPLLKYVVFALRFGTAEGEGGDFALYQGLFPPKTIYHDDGRCSTGDSKHQLSTLSTRSRFLQALKWPLLCWTLFATALTFADGMLTPAVSVTSAVAGLGLSVPSLNNNISSISIGILVALFLAQRFGTGKLSSVFSPVAFIWFSLIGACGIYNITSYPGIFRAFDPSRAVLWFVRSKRYDALAGVLLALTGCEALFANLGQFNRLSIQLSFAFFVYPCLILAYLGQGARLIVAGDEVIANIFYLTIPGGTNGPFYWVVYVFAIVATLIASQTMITATFSLVQQLVNLKSLPPIRMRHTSETLQGQIYIPTANWALCIGTVAFLLIFTDLTRLSYAYGFAVATVMFATTTLIALQIPYVKHKPWVLAVAWLLFFGFLDGLFFGAALEKVPHGAWIPLLIGSVFALFMIFWTWAKALEDEFDGSNRRDLSHFISTEVQISEHPARAASPSLRSGDDARDEAETSEINVATLDDQFKEGVSLFLHGDAPASLAQRISTGIINEDKQGQKEEKLILARLPTCAIFHTLSAGKGAPHTFYSFLRQWPSVPRIVIFLSVHTMPINRVPAEDRYRVAKVRTIPGFYRVTYLKGFRDKFNVDIAAILNLIFELERNIDPRESRVSFEELRFAASHTTHLVPHIHVISKRLTGYFGAPVLSWFRRILIEDIYRSIAYMFPETVNWLASADEIMHVGINCEI